MGRGRKAKTQKMKNRKNQKKKKLRARKVAEAKRAGFRYLLTSREGSGRAVRGQTRSRV